jgi:threonine/homoserine/homoserine lactone efflux protein
MPSIETVITVALAGLVLSITPGPSMLYVLSRSIGQSRAAGLASAIGLGLGGVLLALVAAMGLAAIFQQSQTAYTTLTWAGAAYLVYLGVGMIREKRDDAAFGAEIDAALDTKHSGQTRSVFQIVYQGILVEVLNPKTVLFFMAFIPPFVETSRGDVVAQMLILGVLVPMTALPSDIVVAFVGGSVAATVRANQRWSTYLHWIGGLFLIGIGVSLALS